MDKVLNYGMGVAKLANSIGTTIEEAQKVIDGYYSGLTGVKKYTEDSQAMIKRYGYVTDLWGRRRRIKDATLPEFEVKYKNKGAYEFNPLIGSVEHEDKAITMKIHNYQDRLSKAKWKKDIDNISSQAQKDGFTVKNNRGFINRALRQCLNARIQGSAASMTKLAMIMIDNDKELNELDYHLLATVHDEVLGECPTVNSERAAKRLSEVMIEAARTRCPNVPWKCDGYAVKRWYLDESASEIKKEFNKLGSVDVVAENFPMIKKEYIEQMCNDTFDVNIHEDI